MNIINIMQFYEVIYTHTVKHKTDNYPIIGLTYTQTVENEHYALTCSNENKRNYMTLSRINMEEGTGANKKIKYDKVLFKKAIKKYDLEWLWENSENYYAKKFKLK